MRPRRDAALRLLRVMLVASIGIPVAIFAYGCWATYQNAFAHADEQLQARLNIVSEHAFKIFQSVDLTFAAVDALRGDMSDEQIRASEQMLHGQVKKLEGALNAVDGILVVDKDGKTLVSSAIYPVPASAGVADRDYFLAQKDRDAGTYVGEILQARVRQGAFFAVSRRRPLVTGEFSGVVMVSLVPAEFTEFYRRLADDTGASFSLARKDGAILARYPAPDDGATHFGPNSGFVLGVTQHPEGAIVTSNQSVDGLQRRIGYRKLGYADLYVSDGVTTEAILSEWMHSLIPHLYFGVPATVVLFGLVLMTMARTREFYAEG